MANAAISSPRADSSLPPLRTSRPPPSVSAARGFGCGHAGSRRIRATRSGCTLAHLGSGIEGLTNHEAALRYRSSGPNVIVDSERHGSWRQLLPILANPLSLLLL